MSTIDHKPPRAPGDEPHADRGAVAEPMPAPPFRSRRWRAGNALVSVFARAGIGPIALLTTTGRASGRPHTVPVVPIDHAGARWLVAPYGPVGWVHNARATGSVTLRYGRRRHTYAVREATPTEAAPVLKRYVTIATRARRRFTTPVDAPAEKFVAEAATHPVFELRSSSER
jgi:deazaflavin-dependent oxidoreductase (nitroreductase family)